MGLENNKKLKSVNLQKIKINDAFWTKYTKLVKDVIIPYQRP